MEYGKENLKLLVNNILNNGVILLFLVLVKIRVFFIESSNDINVFIIFVIYYFRINKLFIY